MAKAQTLHLYKFFKSEVKRMDKKDKNTLIYLNNLIGDNQKIKDFLLNHFNLKSFFKL